MAKLCDPFIEPQVKKRTRFFFRFFFVKKYVDVQTLETITNDGKLLSWLYFRKSNKYAQGNPTETFVNLSQAGGPRQSFTQFSWSMDIIGFTQFSWSMDIIGFTQIMSIMKWDGTIHTLRTYKVKVNCNELTWTYI